MFKKVGLKEIKIVGLYFFLYIYSLKWEIVNICFINFVNIKIIIEPSKLICQSNVKNIETNK